jgi:UDP-N-acetylmuramoyl-tripeptide--D-alanyl-D-alanine ligase
MLLINHILKATGGSLLSEGSSSFTSLSTDTRTLKNGEVFLALKGHRFDGHDFIEEALRKGSGIIINESMKSRAEVLRGIYRKTIILVKDTLRALHDLARYLRKERIKEFIGITGSNGKTTTKEMLYTILSSKGTVVKNEGNLNNEIGLPLSIVRESSSYDSVEYGIFEMGAGRRGDIRLLSEISMPDYGVITSIGHAHLEGMGGIEGVFRTKTEIADFVKVLFINGDDELRFAEKGWEIKKEINIIRFGLSDKCHVRAEDIRYLGDYSTYLLRAEINNLRVETPVRLNVTGPGNIYNSLAAASVALYCGIPEEVLASKLEEFRGVKMRLEIKELNGIRFILDCYNANPDSVKNAIMELIRLKKKRAVAVLGDMLELGEYSEALHREVGRFLYEQGVNVFIALGPSMKSAFEEFICRIPKREGFFAENHEEVRKILLKILEPSDTVLIKGSRAMAMEKVLEEIEYAG